MWTRDSPGDPPSPDMERGYDEWCDRMNGPDEPEDDGMPDSYCGCCGNEAYGDWCGRCRGHIAPPNREEHMRTYYAQHHRDCPYQVVPPICAHLNVTVGAGGFGECQDCGEAVV